MRSVTLTHFVNRGQSAPLTARQVYNGLKIKARDATKFVPAIVGCEVLSENETELLRLVTFTDAPNPFKERVEFFPPNIVEFTTPSPSGEIEARVMNIISTTPDGELLLTYTFAIGLNGPEDVGAKAEEDARVWLERADGAIKKTIGAIRELAKEGKV